MLAVSVDHRLTELSITGSMALEVDPDTCYQCVSLHLVTWVRLLQVVDLLSPHLGKLSPDTGVMTPHLTPEPNLHSKWSSTPLHGSEHYLNIKQQGTAVIDCVGKCAVCGQPDTMKDFRRHVTILHHTKNNKLDLRNLPLGICFNSRQCDVRCFFH